MLSGNWTTFEELEECLTVDQMMSLIEAARKKEDRLYKIIMASVGVNIGEDEESDEDLDITRLTGRAAEIEGFGIGMGIEYSIEE
jgi:hypothetical protein